MRFVPVKKMLYGHTFIISNLPGRIKHADMIRAFYVEKFSSFIQKIICSLLDFLLRQNAP